MAGQITWEMVKVLSGCVRRKTSKQFVKIYDLQCHWNVFRLRREYTGDWVNEKKTGKGTMFYANGDRYDGLWLDDKPHDEGRMIYSNGDVYEGKW